MSLALLFLLVCAAVAVFIAIRARGELKGAADPHAGGARCGACGYQVRGIASLTCPECGCDLREVGILPQGVGRGTTPGARIALWLVGVIVAGLVSSGLISTNFFPREQQAHGEVHLLSPQSGLYREVRLQYAWTAWAWSLGSARYQPLRGLIYMTLHLNDGSVHRAEIDPVSGAWSMPDAPSGPAGSAFSAAAVERIYAHSGLPANDGQVQAEIATVVGEISGLGVGQIIVHAGSSQSSGSPQGRAFRSRGQSSGASTGPNPVGFAVLIILWLIVAAWGVRRIMRRGRLFGAG